MKTATEQSLQGPSIKDVQRHELLNLVLIYTNSLLFSGLFTSESVAAYLVKAVFNGSGIIMVAGLLSLTLGFLAAHLSHPKAVSAWGSYWSLKILLYMQCSLAIALIAVLLSKLL